MDILQNLELPELFILLGVGLAVLLFGYRLKKIAFFIIWFLLGFTGMKSLMPTLLPLLPEVATTELYQMLLPLAGGLLLALLGFSIEKICVGGICFALVMMTSIQYFGSDWTTLAIAAVVGVLVAGLAVRLMKPATILATSVAGAYAITIALFGLIAGLDYAVLYWPLLIGLSALGTIFQFSMHKK